MGIERFAENPLIRPEDVIPSRPDFEVIGAFNPAAVRHEGEVLLLLRVAERPRVADSGTVHAPVLDPESGAVAIHSFDTADPNVDAADPRVFTAYGQTYLTSISHFRLARSRDGVHFEVAERPTVFPAGPLETYGIEDPRITPLDGAYCIAYKAVSPNGIATALIYTQDFKEFERRGLLFCPENLDVVLFPERIGGLYYALTRPVPHILGWRGIWIAHSPDLVHWGGHQPLLPPRANTFECAKTGGGCVPIPTDEGWLVLYHAADDHDRYVMAAALLDLTHPHRVLARPRVPLLAPTAAYETQGFYGNVVFACGAVMDGPDHVILYYGAADCCTAAARMSVAAIFDTLDR